MTRSRWSLGCFALGCACGATTPRTQPLATPTPAALETPLDRRLAELSRALAAPTLTPAGVVRRGYLTRGVSVTTALEVPAGRCLSVVSVASPGIRDLDAHLFDPGGDLLVEDIETDAHPTVQLCASEARRVYHVLEAFEGQGAFAVATYLTDRAGLDLVARAVGGHPGTLATGGAAGSGLERRLNELRDGIARRGFTPSGDASRADFDGPGALRLPLAVTPDKCYTLAALADGDITDADLVVYDPEGRALVRDLRAERDAFAQWCPSAPATLSVEVRARPGRGLVLVQAYTADAATLGGANALWLGERLNPAQSALPPEEAAERAVASLGALGFRPATPTERFTLAPGEARERPLALAPRGCTAVSVATGPGLGRARLELQADDGTPLAHGATRSGSTVAVTCAPAASVRAVLVSEAGSGPALYQVWSSPTAPGWSTGLDPRGLSRVWEALWGGPFNPWQEQPPARLGASGTAVRRLPVERPAGRCVRWTLVAGGPAPAVTLEARSAPGAPVARASGEGSATLTRCGREAEALTLDATAEPSGSELVLLGWSGPLVPEGGSPDQ